MQAFAKKLGGCCRGLHAPLQVMRDPLNLIDLSQKLVSGLPAKGLKIAYRAAISGDHT
jgi:hypothetical protein